MGLGNQNSSKAFDNWRHNAVVLRFPNGNEISTVWGFGDYGDNHHVYSSDWNKFLDSNTAEVMIECGSRLSKRLHKKFDGDGSVIGYLSITDWLYIVNALAKEHKENK